MIEKIYNVAQGTIELSFSLFKAAAMTLVPIISFEPLTGISPNNLPEEIAQGNIKAIIITAAGIYTVGAVLSYKYLQMAPPEKIKDDFKNEEELPINHSDTYNDASEKCLNFKIFFHISTGITYTFLDILLQVHTVDKFLSYHKLNNRDYYVASLFLNVPGAITLLLQDVRLIAAMLRDRSPYFEELEAKLHGFGKSTPGICAEAYATAYRTAASKMSLYLMLNKGGNLDFLNFKINGKTINLLAYQVFNPFTAYCKYSNNQTDLSGSEFSNSREKLRSAALAIPFSILYSIDDSSQFVGILTEVLGQNKALIGTIYGAAVLLESIAYSPKSYKIAQSTINKISSCDSPKFSCWQNLSFFSMPKNTKDTLPFDEKILIAHQNIETDKTLIC